MEYASASTCPGTTPPRPRSTYATGWHSSERHAGRNPEISALARVVGQEMEAINLYSWLLLLGGNNQKLSTLRLFMEAEVCQGQQSLPANSHCAKQ